MSWRRIDEITYIDDTLVTCAEYQLFIDEMREQGKYYQPDHWTSYQFPDGQAREPILGIRHSDAVAFCEWLTEHQNDEWYYRIPFSKEGEEYLTQASYPPPIGFWSMGNDQQINITWVGQTVVNPRGIFDTGEPIFNKALEMLHEQPQHSLAYQDGDVPIGFINRDPNGDVLVYVTVLKHLDIALNRSLDFDHDLEIVRDEKLNITFADGVSHLLVRKEPKSIPNNFSRVADINILLNDLRHSILSYTTSPIFDEKIIVDKRGDTAFNPFINLCMEIFADLFTLRERIARRSPAFEGIRLVKERIK